jgi:predicted ATPase/signal transduction histidine kinase
MDPDYTDLSLLDANERFETLRGRRRRTGAPVLIKRARSGSAAAAATPQREGGIASALQKEATIASALPGATVLLPRLVEAAGETLLVMEDPGGELLSTLIAGDRLPLDAVLGIATQLAEALAALHAVDIVSLGMRPDAVLCRTSDWRAWIIDAGDARRLGEAAAIDTARRLVYAAPEQLGPLERDADHRSELYALGIVLYEMLIGAPPFRSDDAQEQIHWHVAGIAAEPSRLDPRVPAVLSALVMKLLAKRPEDRYQTARGLVHDLAVCTRDWMARHAIAPFPLARRDVGDRLVVSPRLYGREREAHQLLEALERTCAGRGGHTVVLVEGYSGIGKTALIRQLYRPIVRQRGYFISGKFDLVARGMPFGALIEAFRALVQQLLTESEERLAHWREALTGALGANGGVLSEVIPEIEFIIGPQPAPPALGSIEAQNRFQRVLESFLTALARPEHPLVLFLDDLQWADAATLDLLQPLATSPALGCLLLMGAYRDHELDASPALAHTLAALNRAGVTLMRMVLGPLALPDVVAFVADTLHTHASEAEPLARIVHAKTGGNPFFVIQFLHLLEREGWLRHDDTQGRWTYDIAAIERAPLADNVVDLMSRAIERLPAKAQYALTLAACIGNRFDLTTLATVSEQSLDATAEDVARAQREGLVVACSDEGGVRAFAFLHDRVQQSAYAMIPSERRQMVHLTVGRLLLARAEATQRDAFAIVQHLNLGRQLVRDAAEQREIAELNLAAGRRAKAATAHASALELFRAGLDLLGARAWSHEAALAFELQLEAAECLLLGGQSEPALTALAGLLEHAATPMARARVLRLRSLQYEGLQRYADALASASEGLAGLGVAFPDAPEAKAAALEREFAVVEALRGGRPVEALADLPTMTDPSVRLVMSILTDSWSAAYIVGDATLARLVSATMVRLSLEHGNVEESAYGYVTHAITVGPVRGDYAAAYEYGRLALEVNRRFDDTRRRAKVYQQFHAHVNLWCRPWHTCIAYAREACRFGLDSGDFLYAAYAAGTEPWAAIVATHDLARFAREYAASVTLIERLKSPAFADNVRLIVNWAKALQGRTSRPLSLTDATLDEAAYVQRYRGNPFFSCIHAVARLHLCVLLGSPAEALDAARHADTLIGHLPGTVWPVIHDFWHGLALAGAIDAAAPDERAAWIERLKQAQASFAARAQHCAENFRCQALLLASEIARVEGRLRDAIEHCEDAIEFAAAGSLLAWHALAHELHGRLRLATGRTSMAYATLSRSRERYIQMGALANAEAMLRQNPVLAQHGAPLEPSAAAAGDAAVLAEVEAVRADPADALDLFSLLKATQAIAGETESAALLARMLHIAIENAGAERGALVLDDDEGPRVYAAEAGAAHFGVEAGVSLPLSDRIPAGIVQLVRRTGQAVVLADATADDAHGSDPYVLRHRPRALACLPVRQQGRNLGALYLEHRGVGAVFTPQRLDILRVLATQAAISLENSRLVAGLKGEIDERRRAQQQLGDALAEVQRLKDHLEAENNYLRRDLIANVSHDLRTPLVSMRGYLEVLATRGEQLDAEQRRQYLGVAVRQSEHLGTLIDELFELAKLDFRGVTPNREPFPFTELATDVVQKFQLAANREGVALEVEAPVPLPFVEADISLMERVLENLVGNALRHTPAGGRVCVAVAAEDGELRVQVRDTGSANPVSELPYVYDRIYRPGPTGGLSGTAGAGLGLAITKRIVEIHGGTVAAASDGRSGSCFSVTLPLRASADAL